ncbi:MAG TPA: hypothetical protein PLA74_12835 [Syntrophales bacterium]|nr:hypothetical protein [Syntrophales bacterium]
MNVMNSITHPASIVLFVYNRPWHTRTTIEALRKNDLADKSDLFIFSDGPKGDNDTGHVFEVREYIRSITGFKSIQIMVHKENHGLANSVIAGVTEVIKNNGRTIVLEDDLVTSPYFLHFMNSALRFYQDTENVFTICGYNYPPSLVKIPRDYPHDVFFSYRNSSWGWATWKDRWLKADWQVSDYSSFKEDRCKQKSFNRGGDDLSDMLIDQKEGRIDSWAIRWTYTHFVHNALALWPVHSFVNNIGHDNSGTHSKKTDRYKNDLTTTRENSSFPPVPFVNEKLLNECAKVYKRGPLTRLKKFIQDVR